jgi:hypothetical protein
MKVHVSAISFRKARTIGLTQGSEVRLAALVANFAAFVAATMIKAYSGALSGHTQSTL